MRITTGKLVPTQDDREGLDAPADYIENEWNEPATLQVTTFKMDDEAESTGIILVGSATDSQRVTLFNLTYAEAHTLVKRLNELLP